MASGRSGSPCCYRAWALPRSPSSACSPFTCTCARPGPCSRWASASRKCSNASATGSRGWCASAPPRCQSWPTTCRRGAGRGGGHVGGELQDELGALLTAAKLDVARLKSKLDAAAPDIAERLAHLTQTLNSGIALKRRIIEDLRPSSLSNLGLTAALEILTREFAGHAGIEVETSLETVQLPEAVQLTVYRMVQEALTNIGKYAKAQQVLVSVPAHPGHVAVQVRDDGQGFDPAALPPTSHGLAGMRHRVEAAGGRLSITSRPGGGTLLSAILPLRARQPA